MKTRCWCALIAALVAAVYADHFALAQQFPSKPLRIVVPVPAVRIGRCRCTRTGAAANQGVRPKRRRGQSPRRQHRNRHRAGRPRTRRRPYDTHRRLHLHRQRRAEDEAAFRFDAGLRRGRQDRDGPLHHLGPSFAAGKDSQGHRRAGASQPGPAHLRHQRRRKRATRDGRNAEADGEDRHDPCPLSGRRTVGARGHGRSHHHTHFDHRNRDAASQLRASCAPSP